jgi:hypothetical protein
MNEDVLHRTGPEVVKRLRRAGGHDHGRGQPND